MYNQLLVVRSKDQADATVRLQSDAILRALECHQTISASLADPRQAFEMRSGCFVLFHFDDAPAISALTQAREKGVQFTAACFGSDIYRFERYLASYDAADMYLVPTELHRSVLASQFYKPVYCLPECIDPITGFEKGKQLTSPAKQSRRVLWFGYPESFNKGMSSLVPIVKMNKDRGCIKDFTLILDEHEFVNEHGFPTMPFRTDSFRKDALSFDYCILSHFSLDLHLNSSIKSPNKLITALMLGLIPLASNTANYRSLLEEFGLQRFLFDSPAGLDRILSTLDPVADSEQIARSGIIETLADRYSDRQSLQNLLGIQCEFALRDHTSMLPFRPRPMPAASERSPVSFTQHLKDLAPSAWRGVRHRLDRN